MRKDLEVTNINEDNNEQLPLPRRFIRPDLPGNNEDIKTPSQLKKRKYLKNVMNQLNFSHSISVGLLTGANCTNALRPIKVLQYKNGGSYAFKTELMWCVFGQVNRTKSNKIFYNHLAVNQADAKEVGRPFFQVKKEVIENEMPDMLEQIYNHEFTES